MQRPQAGPGQLAVGGGLRLQPLQLHPTLGQLLLGRLESLLGRLLLLMRCGADRRRFDDAIMATRLVRLPTASSRSPLSCLTKRKLLQSQTPNQGKGENIFLKAPLYGPYPGLALPITH